jgi:outer membrane lipoprotein-sorting protein
MVSFRPDLATVLSAAAKNDLRGRLAVLAATLALLWPSAAPAADPNSLVASWLGAQTNIHNWSADFIQTRTFKSLTRPLTATGHVWFAEPNRFHWELGNPPQTIAVKAATALLVIYPRLKRVERYPLTGEQAGQWREALALLEAGFPRSQAELTTRFKILSQTVRGQDCELALQPKSPAARKMMPEFKVAFNLTDFSLQATELQFADGSTIRNRFTNAVLNPRIDPELFDPKIGPDFKIIEPLKAGP